MEKIYSIKSVLKIAIPLMLNAVGPSIMVSIDRIMVSRYDYSSMASIVFVGTLIYLFESSVNSVAITSQIFSSQFFGAEKNSKVSVAPWQMLYFSIIFGLIVIPLALLFSKDLILELHYEKGKNFFRILMITLFLSPAIASINGFFIGIKKPFIISVNAIASNFLNIFLNYIFIFGVEGYIKPMGVVGCAIGTSISLIIQFIVIFTIFLKKEYAKIYNTRKFSIDKKLFWSCLKIGLPSSLGMFFEIYTSFKIQSLITIFTPKFIDVTAIGINLLVIMIFIIIGIEKGASSLSANLIGQKNYQDISKLIHSSILIHFIFTSIIFTTVYIFKDFITDLYNAPNQTKEYFNILYQHVIIYYFFDGIAWIICGVLISGGDSFFVMITTIFVNFFLRLAPLFLVLKYGYSSLTIAWTISAISSIIFGLIVFFRYLSGKWIKVEVSDL